MNVRSQKKRARERIENIKAQIEAYERGDVLSIACPYCGGINVPEKAWLCCKIFSQASVAALERLRLEQSKQVIERVMERHAKN